LNTIILVILGGIFMAKRERIRYEDIKVVIMNPECLPITQKKIFDFFYEKVMREQAQKQAENENKLKEVK
jgi:hypothetical protein